MNAECPAIVVDNGSDEFKAGFADRDHPSVTFPNIMGRPRQPETWGNKDDRFFGHDVSSKKLYSM
jgi:actin-related protein